MSIFMLNGSIRNIVWVPKTASTALTKNSVVGFAGSGTVQNVSGATGTSTEIFGVIKRDVKSTDADYASASNVPVEVWDPAALYYADVTAGGSATTANVGIKYDIDTSTSPYLGINLGGTSNKSFLILRVLSTTQVVGMLVGSSWSDVTAS